MLTVRNLISFNILILFSWNFAHAQMQFPEFTISKTEVEGHLRFLASDALQGRNTGSEGNRIAAAYIAAQLEAYGVQKPAATNSYFQPVDLEQIQPITQATLTWNKNTFKQKETLMMLRGKGGILNANAVFAGHGWVDEAQGINDYAGLDVKGKIVITNIGLPNDRSPQATFQAITKKRELAKAQGAIAVVELFQLGKNFWTLATNYFGNPSMELASTEDAPKDLPAYGWILEGDSKFSEEVKKGKKNKVVLTSNASSLEKIKSDNVIGVIYGSNPALREEYVVLSAHYDHVGVGKQGGGAYTEQDSIFNGARDNAFGTTALLTAAKALAAAPPERSVIILAVTGEEKGLLGSRYYANHPIFPLEKTIYNFNTDGAGYNAMDKVTIFGLGRTGTDSLLVKGAAEFGLAVNDDPAPEQGLFDRSDNVSFAAKGVPAITYSPGFTAFDESIMKYYHQVTDNPDTIDFDYLTLYAKAFSYTARLLANIPTRPFWVTGDKYEAAGKQLYSIE